MCLTINPIYHKSLFGYYLPKIATTNILVYKYLKEEDSHIITPYQETLCIFENGECILKAKKLKHDKRPFNNDINEGIHAVINLNSDYSISLYTRTYLAIIPKGTLYYIGTSEDIVSKKLIIFTDTAFKEWYKKNNYTIIKLWQKE